MGLTFACDCKTEKQLKPYKANKIKVLEMC